MKTKYLILCLFIILTLSLTGCKSNDYNNALRLEDSGDYEAALEIFETLSDYKDSSTHVASCQEMISALEKFDTAVSYLREKNDELASAITSAHALLTEDKPALDESLASNLETAISQASAAKVDVPDPADTADEIIQLADELSQTDYNDVLEELSTAQTALETSITQYSLVDQPSESYIISCLNRVPTVDDISAVTEDDDPNGQLNKAGGYTADVYFSSDLIDQGKIIGKTIIDKGTSAGGSIEVYTTAEDALARDNYLSAFDGSVLASGSHTVVGTVVVRTSDELTASQQTKLESWIVACLTAVPDEVGVAIQIGNYAISLQDYWEEDGSNLSDDYYQLYAETAGKIAMLSISYSFDDEDPVSMDELYADNDNMITMIEHEYGNCKVTDYQDFQSDSGVNGILYHFTFNMEGISGKGDWFCFPSETDSCWYTVLLIESDNTEKDYTDDFTKTLSSIKEISSQDSN
jgi:hypothetical protein